MASISANFSVALCSRCGGRSRVEDSRKNVDGSLRRRRYCTTCNHMWSTKEVIVVGELDGSTAVLGAADDFVREVERAAKDLLDRLHLRARPTPTGADT